MGLALRFLRSDWLDTGPRWTPVDMERVAAGALHTCALDVEGVAYCWGQNDFGQLGRGTFGGTAFAPEPVLGPSFVHLDAGARQSCGLTASGEAYCWGQNLEGQLGNPDHSDDPLAAVPGRIPARKHVLHQLWSAAGGLCPPRASLRVSGPSPGR